MRESSSNRRCPRGVDRSGGDPGTASIPQERVSNMNMNCRNTIIAAGLLALAAVGGAHLVSAQESPKAPNIAVMDVQVLLQHSAMGKYALAQIEKMDAEYQRKIDGKFNGIAKAYESLRHERPNLSEDAYQQRLLGLRKRTESEQRAAEQTQSKLDGERSRILQKTQATIEQIVDQIIKEQKVTMVLPRSVVIGTSTSPDITQEVLRRLDHLNPTGKGNSQ